MASLLRVLLLISVCLGLAELTAARIERRLQAWATPPARRAQLPRAGRPSPPQPEPGLVSVAEQPTRPLSPHRPVFSDAAPADLSPQYPLARPVTIQARPAELPSTSQSQASANPAPVPRQGGTLSREELADIFLKAMDRLTLKQAHRPDGKPMGVYIAYSEITPLSRLGIQSGDILTALNGHPLLTREDYRWAGNALRDESQFALGVDRGGTPLTLNIQVTGKPAGALRN